MFNSVRRVLSWLIIGVISNANECVLVQTLKKISRISKPWKSILTIKNVALLKPHYNYIRLLTFRTDLD